MEGRVRGLLLSQASARRNVQLEKKGQSLTLAFVTLSTFEDLQRCSGSVGGGGKQAGVVSRILLFLFYFVFVG